MISDPDSKLYWTMVKSAGGVVSEERFSGRKTTPNREQLLWTVLNSLVDDGVNIEAEDIKNVPDFYIYELSQRMPIEELAKKYTDTTIEDIQAIIRRHVDTMFELQQYAQIADADLTNKLSEKFTPEDYV